MPCLNGTFATVVRVCLAVDVIAYLLYAAAHKKKIVEAAVSFVLNMNLLILFFLSFMTLTGIELNKTMESFGVAIAALFSILQLFAITETIVKVVVFTLLNIVSQLTHNYLPTLLSEKLGIGVVLASSVTLLIPVVMLVLVQLAVFSKVFTTALVSIVLSWLVVQAFDVFHHDFSVSGPVCCEIEGYCSIWTTKYELALLVGLIAFILLIVLRDWIAKNCACCSKKEQAVALDEVLNPPASAPRISVRPDRV